MKTTLTSKNLEILYNMACQMAPFNTLPMPKSSKVRFKVIKDPTIYGCFNASGGMGLLFKKWVMGVG
jgi:hypothetical protein